MNIEILLFYLLSSLAILSGSLVISARNPMHSILFLVLVFSNAAGLLLLLESDFLAMLLLVVYVGAIAVLFLFVVMMLNIRLTELKENVFRYLPIGSLLLLIFLFEIISVINGDLVPFFSFNTLNIENQALLIGNDLKLIIWSNTINPSSNIESIGSLLYTYYFYPFIMASLVLLVAMIGAILLTMRKQFNVRRQEVFDQVFNNLNTSLRLVK